MLVCVDYIKPASGIVSLLIKLETINNNRMLKRPCSSVVLKRHGSSFVLLPHHVVELILERLPVKSLLRFKSVSKKWESTIESHSFKERQLIRSRGPDVIFVISDDIQDEAQRRRIVLLGSSIIRIVKLPTSNSMICHGSCDGLICLFSMNRASNVVNPATKWHRSFPPSNVQKRISDKRLIFPFIRLGFGKDKFSGTYKPVLLCNSSEYDLANATTCEVFDFSTNAWRYVVPASPYRIRHQKPVYFDGSLYWLTECEETMVISFDLHTEMFQVICKAPFPHSPSVLGHHSVLLCILDNRLCVSQKKGLTQVIWSLDSSGSNKTWKELCSLDLTNKLYFPSCSYLPVLVVVPLAILEKKKLLLGRDGMEPLVIHDLHTKSNDIVLRPRHFGFPVCYFESLFSVSSH